MKLLISKMSKEEILAREAFRCPNKTHGGKDGFEHRQCFNKFYQGQFDEKVLFFDIEASDLNADYGIMFNWYAIDNRGNRFEDSITLKDIKKYRSRNRDVEPKEDTRIVKNLVKLMSSYRRVIGHYSCGFDIPFTRTRAVIDKIDFPAYGTLFQSDTWVILKKKFKLSRNSLENGCKRLVGVTQKDRLSMSVKHGCLRGERWAINVSKQHCKQDVEDLVNLFEVTGKYMKRTKSSI